MRILSLVSKVPDLVAIASACAIAAIAQPAFVYAQAAAGPTTPDAPAGIVLSVKQLTIAVDPDGDPKANGEKVAAFQSATLGIFSCDDVAGVAQSTGATVTTADSLPLDALPPPLRTAMATMRVGTATHLFGDRAKGQVNVLVLCGRH